MLKVGEWIRGIWWGIMVGSDHAGMEADSAGASVPSRSFDWRPERRSGLWNLAFLARGAEIMVLSSGSGLTFYSPHTHPSPAHSEGIWLFSQSAGKKMFDVKAGRDGSGEGLDQGSSLSQPSEAANCFSKGPFPDLTTSKKILPVIQEIVNREGENLCL